MLAMGTTDAANIAAGAPMPADRRIDRMMAVIGDDPVLWVDVKTLRTDGPWSELDDAGVEPGAHRGPAARYPNIKVYDWAGVVQDAWFGDDRIHYTTEGYTQRARLIADALGDRLPGAVGAAVGLARLASTIWGANRRKRGSGARPLHFCDSSAPRSRGGGPGQAGTDSL